MLIGDDADYDVDDDDPQVSASSPNFSMVETDVTTIKLTGLAPNTQVDNQESKHMDSGTADHCQYSEQLLNIKSMPST